jgi:pimeloyl-ACP methyl ester carboxylesterase
MRATPTISSLAFAARRRRVALGLGLSAALLAPGVAVAQGAPAPPADADAPGLHREVAFDHYPQIATGAALAGRLLGPKSYRELQDRLAASGEDLRESFLDLPAERFAVYVPKRKPPAGYALIVFIPPWPEAALPPGWGAVLDDYGAIFVTAARSGNEESVHRRRIPLALVAAANVAARYEIDRSRVYVAGFSGGSRAAERLALEFPDLFSGAILNAGADPLGQPDTPIPHAALLERFQTGSRLVLVTGERDEAGAGMDATARTSLRDWCVAHVRQITMLHVGHQAATPEALAEALKALGGEADARDRARGDRCRAELAARLAADVAKVRSLRTAGAPPETIAAETDRLEARYGWLAADALAAPPR